MRLNPSLALELPRLAERREDLPEMARATAGAFFSDVRHRRAIAALVRASGGPEPPLTDEALALALSEDEARRSERVKLAAELGSDRSAGAGHQYPPAGDVAGYLCRVDVGRVAAE